MLMVGGGGAVGQNMVEADEGIQAAGCEGASGLPRQSRHNRHAYSLLESQIMANKKDKSNVTYALVIETMHIATRSTPWGTHFALMTIIYTPPYKIYTPYKWGGVVSE